MVLYTCQRCGYENKIKSHFIKHLNRKKPCDITLLAVDKRVSNKKSYIEKKKDGKIIDITKIDFDLEQKIEENPDFEESYTEVNSKRSQIDFEVKKNDFGSEHLTSELSKNDFGLYEVNSKPKSNQKVIQKNGKITPPGRTILPSLDNSSDFAQNMPDFSNLRPIKNSEGKFECPLCGAVYGRKNNCTQHLKNRCKVRKSKLIQQMFDTGQDQEFSIIDEKSCLPEKSYKKVISPKSNFHTVEEKKLYSNFVSENESYIDSEKVSCEKSYITNNNGDNEDNNINLDDISNHDYKIAVIERELFKKENDELRKQVEMLISKVGNTTVNVQQNIIINNLGNEEVGYINSDIVNKLISAPYVAIPKLIETIHFNPDHPENHNIKITNKKERYVKVYKDNKWRLEDKKEVIDKMVDKGKSILDEHRDESRHSAFKNKCYDHFSQKYDDGEKDLIKKINKDVELVVLNNSE